MRTGSGCAAAYGDSTLNTRHHFEELREVLRDQVGGVEKMIRALDHLRKQLPRRRGMQAVLTPRGWDQSERFDEAWALLAAEYQVEVHVLANVIPFRPSAPPNKARRTRAG
jgi:hypothetical protein